MHELVIALVAAFSFAAMAVLFNQDATPMAATTPVVTTAETLLVAGASLPLPFSTGKVCVRGWLTLLVGTNTTAVTVKIYRGATAAGTLVGSTGAMAGNFTAGNTSQFMLEVTDVLTGAGSAQYCMTVTQTGASANGSVVNATLNTMLLSG